MTSLSSAAAAKVPMGETGKWRVGGKRRLAKHIIPMLPEHSCYVEPCAGAAAILFMKEPSKVEILNDVNLDLVTLYRVVQHHLEEFLRQFKWALTSRKMFEWLQDTPPDTLTDIQRSARFFYLQKLSFGGKVDGRTFGTATTSTPRLNLLRLEEDLSQAHLRLAKVCIEHLSWQRCIEKYDREHTLFYLDPPYWQTEGYGVPFGLDQYRHMAELMKSMKGRAVLSINDHPDILAIFAGMPMKTVAIDYTVGGAHKGVGRQELIIWNW